MYKVLHIETGDSTKTPISYYVLHNNYTCNIKNKKFVIQDTDSIEVY